MKHILIKGTVAAILTIALLFVTTANAQTQTNTTAKVNMTASKVPGNTTAKVNQTASESGKNNTTANILNKTKDLGKKIAGGLGSLLGNASEKLKQGSK
jgi:hypothetical protein